MNSKMNSDLHFKSELCDTGLLAKIRRLKIQERQLLNFLSKVVSNFDEGDVDTNTFPSSNLKSLTNCIGQKYRELNNLYEDLKVNINQKEKFAEIDIEDAKKDVIELEQKIKGFKMYIQNEIISLKDAEEKLLEEVNHNPNDAVQKLKIGAKIKFKPYNDIIPSPVKCMINAPLKSNEIQEFQDFIKKNHKYGWWDEYNHNIFLQCWKKYFNRDSDISSNCYELENIKNSNTFKLFHLEVLQKISGSDEQSVISHCEWYMKYIYYKERQQKAIIKWKEYKAKTKSCSSKSDSTAITSDKYSKKEKGNDSVRDPEIKNEKRENYMLETQMDSGLENTSCTYATAETFFVKKNINYQPIFPSSGSNYFQNTNDFQYDHREKQPLNRTQIERLGKPTKQWQNRCDGIDDSLANNDKFNIDNIQKLRTPMWRHSLRKSD